MKCFFFLNDFISIFVGVCVWGPIFVCWVFIFWANRKGPKNSHFFVCLEDLEVQSMVIKVQSMASPLTQLQEADGRENSLQGPSSCESRVHVISGVF